MIVCFECGEPATCRHHVVPRALGGTQTVPLCNRCHEHIHGSRFVTSGCKLTIERAEKMSRIRKTNAIKRSTFGYRVGDGEVIQDPHRQAIIRQIMMIWDMEGERRAPLLILQMLRRCLIPPPDDRKNWTYIMIDNIIQRELAGIVPDLAGFKKKHDPRWTYIND